MEYLPLQFEYMRHYLTDPILESPQEHSLPILLSDVRCQRRLLEVLGQIDARRDRRLLASWSARCGGPWEARMQRLIWLFEALGERGIEGFSTPFAQPDPVPDWTRLPAKLQYLAAPADEWGLWTDYDQRQAQISALTPRQWKTLRDLADRTNADESLIEQWLRWDGPYDEARARVTWLLAFINDAISETGSHVYVSPQQVLELIPRLVAAGDLWHGLAWETQLRAHGFTRRTNGPGCYTFMSAANVEITAFEADTGRLRFIVIHLSVHPDSTSLSALGLVQQVSSYVDAVQAALRGQQAASSADLSDCIEHRWDLDCGSLVLRAAGISAPDDAKMVTLTFGPTA